MGHVIQGYALRYADAVAAELQPSYPSGREFWRLVQVGELRRVNPQIEHIMEFSAGERAAIRVAVEHPDWVLLLDDLRPFRAAAALGVNVLCTPVLAVALYVKGEISALDALMALARLATLQTVSPHLLAAALAQLGRSVQQRGSE